VRELELRRGRDGEYVERFVLPVHSGKDPLALLLEAAEDLCLEEVGADHHRIAMNDLAPFVLPRFAELLDDPENDELVFVCKAGAGEKVSEHAIKRAIAKASWPTSGSLALETAVLACYLRGVCSRARGDGHDVEILWRTR